uniref:Reverse transcriptase zinc-binding domain-containing protein n=1 Tax=Fagus sylvatica TaxID=28930 RepID=A0A2N9FJQ0_FAGSY
MQGVIGDELLAVEDLHGGETCVVTIVQPPLDVGLVLRSSNVKPNGMGKKDEAVAFGGSEGLRGRLGIKKGVGVAVLDRDELANTPKKEKRVEAMLEGLVRQLLLGYLGRFVKDIPKEQLKIALWNGQVLLENVELILEAFDYLQLPFALKQVLIKLKKEKTITLPHGYGSERSALRKRTFSTVLTTKPWPEFCHIYGIVYWLANLHRNANSIANLNIDGILSSNQDDIRDHIASFYEHLYMETGYSRPLMDGMQFFTISDKDAAWLERLFDEEEIAGVVQGFNGDKAPGSDGFSLAFFQQCWSVVRDEVLAVCQEFHEHCHFERSLNATFVSLIPKKHGADEIKDFRPISLVGEMWFFGEIEEVDFLLYLFCPVFHIDQWEASDPIRISHLLFADDTLIFCEASLDNLIDLRAILTWFEATSGLRVNLGKSELAQVGEVPHLEALAEILGCKTSALPMKYLGLPLGAHFKVQSIWNPIVEKLDRRLAGWKRLYLSKGGRLTLIKSTLSNLPTYYLSLFPIPVAVAKRIETIQRNFLWEDSEEVTKFHLVNWDIICTPFSNGGLNIRSLRRFNEALLGKWLWRFGVEREVLWRQVVMVKCGALEGGWTSKMPTGTYGVGLWKFIRFGPLKSAYPELYRIARAKDAFVADNFQCRGDSIHWEVTFSRLAQDWEMESFSFFLELLYSFTGTGSGEDKVCWKPAQSKSFQVKSYYKSLTTNGEECFPWKSIWKAKVPPRVAFFSWTAALGRILIAKNLRRRRVIIVSWCCLCKMDGESVDHLLLHCAYAKELWDLVFAMFGISWVMPTRVRDLFDCWLGKMGKHPIHMI